MDKRRKELADRIKGALPRYPKSDDAKAPVVLKASEVNEVLAYLTGER
jgi:hypothetical protein